MNYNLQDITVATYREGDPDGQAARAIYKHLSFAEGRLTEAFGHPIQELNTYQTSVNQTKSE
ncbi:hypothetical protein ACTQ34_16895 [Agathobaculum sp. LCP25S3_E8]|uniref:hypothetical protein n=1 Tax=Agathobaculum sp. LCP25S3_E8 TaxID=3438735 RepID=UPI003F8F9EC7